MPCKPQTLILKGVKSPEINLGGGVYRKIMLSGCQIYVIHNFSLAPTWLDRLIEFFKIGPLKKFKSSCIAVTNKSEVGLGSFYFSSSRFPLRGPVVAVKGFSFASYRTQEAPSESEYLQKRRLRGV